LFEHHHKYLIINQINIIMKNTFISFILITATYIFSSCSGNSSSSNSATATANTDSSISADKKVAAMDTSNHGKAIMDDNTKDFANKATTGGMEEVELGKLAEQKALSPEVKDFGKMMVEDHTLLNNNFKTIASKKNMELPTSITDDQRKDIDNLSKKSGKDFDKAYVDMMVEDHKKDIGEFNDAKAKVLDNDVKDFITSTLPTLQKHLNAIQAIK
jgi:putative membrane protein